MNNYDNIVIDKFKNIYAAMVAFEKEHYIDYIGLVQYIAHVNDCVSNLRGTEAQKNISDALANTIQICGSRSPTILLMTAVKVAAGNELIQYPPVADVIIVAGNIFRRSAFENFDVDAYLTGFKEVVRHYQGVYIRKL